MPSGCYIRTKEHKRKISEGLKGNKNSLGYKHSIDTRLKMSDSKKGKIPYLMTEGIKEKISKSLKGNVPWNKGLKNWRKGYEHSEETKRKIGEGNTKRPEERISKSHDLLRKEKKYKGWQSDIFKRDNWTCQNCGRRSKAGGRIELNAHHVIEFAQILKENNIKTIKQAYQCKELWNLENGVTLCDECHKIVHRFTGQKAIKLKSTT